MVYEQSKQGNKTKLDANDPASLLGGLMSDNLLWRLHAQRLIIEMGYSELEPELISLISDAPTDHLGLKPAAIHAIWTLQGLGLHSQAARDALINALRHDNFSVRKAAIQALPVNDEIAGQIINSNILNDPNLNTRLAALIRTLSIPENREVGSEIYNQSLRTEVAQDLWLSKAVQAAALVHKSGFLQSFNENDTKTDQESLSGKIYTSYDTENFPLQNGDYASDALNIAGKVIKIEGRIWVANPDDIRPYMIFSHGDDINGYGVYSHNNKWSVYVNKGGRTSKSTSDFDAGNWFGFVFNFSGAGMATLEIDNQIIVQVKANGLVYTGL